MSRRSLSVLAPLAIAMAIAASPSVASAAQRYASPTGDGSGCTAAVPCSVGTAVKIATASGDEVILSEGVYDLTDTVEDKAEITLRGMAGQPRPRLRFSGQFQAGLRLMHGSLLRDVEIEQARSDASAVTTSGARLDRVVVRGGGGPECAVSLRNGLIRDAIVVAGMTPICTFGTPNTIALRNVTAVATQPGQSAIAIVATTGPATVELRNVIAKGGPGGLGFSIVTDFAGGPATVTAAHSNFTGWDGFGDQGSFTYIDGGGNQQAPPTFVNAATGDYRQAPGSVTIDAGVNEALNGAFDVDGDLRRIGTTDIGADEFVPAPTVSTGPAGAIGSQSATLTGSIAGIGVPGRYWFEFGPTTAYTSATPAADVSLGLGALPVAATLDGLSPGTTYHFRLVASNKGGLSQGQDQTFTTSAAAPSPPTSSPSTSAGATPAFAGVSLVSTRLALSRKVITVKLSCPAAAVGGCSGQTKLSARGRAGTGRVVLGKARFSMAAGHPASVRVRLSRAGLQRLRGVRRLRARDTNVAHDGAGTTKTTVATVTVRRKG